MADALGVSATIPTPSKHVFSVALALVFVGGGVRLAYDEVRIAGEVARVRGLEEKAALADEDRRRVIELERAVAAASARAGALESELSLQRAAVARLEQRLTAERAAAAERLAATRQAAAAELAQARAEAARRLAESQAAAKAAAERARAALERALAERDRAAGIAEERARKVAALERDLEDALAALAEREDALAEARRAAEGARQQASAAQREVRSCRERVAALEHDLAAVRERAERAAKTLRRLEEAGVNVARLSGQRPMPALTGVVVRVDGDALPPEVLVDLGRAAGLEVGDRLYVLRGGKAVARLEVVEVLASVSRARLVHGERGLVLRSGDDVTSVAPSVPPQ